MEFSPHKIKSNVYCCVYGCKSHASKHETVRFHSFPKKNDSCVKIQNTFNQEELVDRHDMWVKVLRIGKKISPSMRVCSRHFTKDDYIPSLSQQLYLKKTAVPSVNLPKSSVDCSKKLNNVLSAQREQRQIKRSFLKNEETNIQPKTTNEPSDFNTDNNFQDELVIDYQIDHRHADESQPNNFVGKEDSHLRTHQVSRNEAESCSKNTSEIIIKQFKEVATQVRTDNFIPKFTDFISTDSELSTLTGIPNFTLLNSIKKLVDKKKPTTSHCNAKLDSLDIIIMTFIKLKQNMSYALLAVLFKFYTPETCKEKIFQMIDLLYICLKPGIHWPKKENILKNIPLDFIGFENVRAVIDCTEMSIQRPKRLCCQVVTYSRYKSCYTVKFMTAVTPAGLISFISKPFGGRASDNAIFRQSEIIAKFDKKDDVMADRGFTVDEF